MKLTRRELAGMVAAGTAAAQAPGTNPESPAKLAPSPVEALKETVAEIRNLKVPIETEPAFAFRAQ
ncbi:MAG TPA: hypothetical protein VF767_00380 [Bryobacteraceae bacterium]